MPVVEIITLTGTILMLCIQVVQMMSQGHFKSECCDGCMTIEHDENKNDNVNINISHDFSSD